ncbi:SixA phosphatase family protein [Winogradskyella alexanderae]|uniref:Histidine phosphatase family protein n=1 Tax=Winogradskyella alexanderae TaxID=2877123 RepID=A0ABS7XX10_9FLAO|nr:histidine phosphatase family protein [Winogradskyella alexanderae]MCA0133432.1 histidine phosphatase family protein [Winogradskyella alexanderae]
MKTLILMRHGKSSWEFNVNDKERPLKTRGLNDASLVSKHFLINNTIPEKIFSSPAKRAHETCKIFLKMSEKSENEVTIIEDLYDFNGSNVINFLRNLKDSINSVMIFGHNHAFTSISNIFGDNYIDNLPTSGLVKIIFDTNSWRAIEKGKTELIIIPKELR